MDKINICIIHYNTPLLTECLVKSINKFTPNCIIYIFDNSDKEPFTYKQNNIIYIDNTKGVYIDFEKEKIEKNGSMRHCRTVQKCIELINKCFILLDSDVLLTRDISEIIDEDYICGGEIQKFKDVWLDRIYPFIFFINPKKIKENNLYFFDKNRIIKLGFNRNAGKINYDTGSSFYEDIKEKKNPIKEFSKNNYIVHFEGASHRRTKEESMAWLNNNEKYWK